MHFIILIIGCKTYNIRAKIVRKKFPRKGGGSTLFKKGGYQEGGDRAIRGDTSHFRTMRYYFASSTMINLYF